MAKKKAYYVYVKDADKWTVEDENAHDYVLLVGNEIFFISRVKLDDCEEAEYIPAKVASWLAECESKLIIQRYARKMKAAAKKLETDFQRNLDEALDELRKSTEDTDETEG